MSDATLGAQKVRLGSQLGEDAPPKVATSSARPLLGVIDES